MVIVINHLLTGMVLQVGEEVQRTNFNRGLVDSEIGFLFFAQPTPTWMSQEVSNWLVNGL